MQVSGLEGIATRKVRQFGVYKNARLMFKAESKAGVLQSVVTPGPEGAAKHAWINVLSFRGSSENDWIALLRQSKNFDGFLKLLIANGYDLFSIDKTPAPLSISEGHRITDGNSVLGVTWDLPGQFSTLNEQPEVGQLISRSVSMVVYDAAKASSFAQIFERAKSYVALQEAFRGMRLKASNF